MSTEIRIFIPAKRTPALPVARAHPGAVAPRADARAASGIVKAAGAATWTDSERRRQFGLALSRMSGHIGLRLV
jgi:hypothetical protein